MNPLDSSRKPILAASHFHPVSLPLCHLWSGEQYWRWAPGWDETEWTCRLRCEMFSLIIHKNVAEVLFPSFSNVHGLVSANLRKAQQLVKKEAEACGCWRLASEKDNKWNTQVQSTFWTSNIRLEAPENPAVLNSMPPPWLPVSLELLPAMRIRPTKCIES